MSNGVKILLILINGFEDIEAVTAIDICGWTKYKPGLTKVSLVTAGLHGKVIGRYGIDLEEKNEPHHFSNY